MLVQPCLALLEGELRRSGEELPHVALQFSLLHPLERLVDHVQRPFRVNIFRAGAYVSYTSPPDLLRLCEALAGL